MRQITFHVTPPSEMNRVGYGEDQTTSSSALPLWGVGMMALAGSDQPWMQEFHRHGLDRTRDGLREHKFHSKRSKVFIHTLSLSHK